MDKAARGLARLDVGFDIILESTRSLPARRPTSSPPNSTAIRRSSTPMRSPRKRLRAGDSDAREARAQAAHRPRGTRTGHRRAGRTPHRIAPRHRIQEGRDLPDRPRRDSPERPGRSPLAHPVEVPPLGPEIGLGLSQSGCQFRTRILISLGVFSRRLRPPPERASAVRRRSLATTRRNAPLQRRHPVLQLR